MGNPGERAAMPAVVSEDEWRTALASVRAEEKALTRQGDAVAARRRRLPMVRIDRPYTLTGPAGHEAPGPVTLAELFDGRRQLIVYHFMFGTDWEAGCEGCSWVVDAMSHPAHLLARDVSLAVVSLAPIEKLTDYRRRMGWDIGWYSSAGTTFNDDMGATVDGEESHGLSVFLRDGDDIFRTYFTEDRGVEHLGSHWSYLDLTPYGRQESWEDSPAGWPQAEPYTWTRRHDEY